MMTLTLILNIILALVMQQVAEPTTLAGVSGVLPKVQARDVAAPTPTIPAPSVSAAAVGVWDPATETFLYEKAADAIHPIASVTKLMTVLIALDEEVTME